MQKNPRNQIASRTGGKPPRRSAARRALLLSILVAFCASAVVASGVLFSHNFSKANAATQNSAEISPEALAQIESLIKEKEGRTPAQQKIDSQLLYRVKMNRNELIAPGVPSLETDLVEYDDEGQTLVDISTKVTNSVLRRMRSNGAVIISSDARYNSVRAMVKLDRIERIAQFPEVSFIQPKQEAMSSASAPRSQQHGQYGQTQNDLPPGFKERADRVRQLVGELLPKNQDDDFSIQSVGSRATEGDTTHKAINARSTFGVNGTGVKIGVLSDGVTNLAASQARGDLGPVTVLPGQGGSGDEGTAMLEIIHDLAPGAKLYFATAFTSITSFAQNIRDLRTAGCDIIVDDVFYFVESPFQDGAPGPTNTNGGVVIQAVNDVVAAGAMYFSSAGNSGNKNDNRSGVWEGDFVDGGASAAPLPLTGRVHNFGGQNFDVITANGSQINLYWSDPLGGSSNDYDLFILNGAGTAVLASSTNIQNGTQDPFEVTGTGVNLRIVVLKKASAAARFLHVDTNRGRLSINTAGQSHGHACATGAFGCAATPASNFAAPPNPAGPFPNPFNATNTVELFSSDGPRQIFYNANSTAITPGNVSSTGGTVLQKPDITAADGVTVTGVGGFGSPFFGTSAAAPHAAAIAGLLKSGGPFSNAQVKTALLSTAIDIEAAGTDRDSGAGIIMAFEALNSLGAAPSANVDLGTVTAQENPGNGDGLIQPGEGAKLTIQLTNNGPGNATGISAALTTATPGVSITQPGTSGYPDLPSLTGQANNTTPFTFTLAPNFPCGTSIIFNLTVTYTGGPSPKEFSFTVGIGDPPAVITTVLDATPPAAGTVFTTATGTQTNRINRNGLVGTCAAAKAFPGAVAAGPRQFDAYTFATCANSGPYCVTVTLTNNCTGNKQLFGAVYAGSFVPASIGTNYLSDPGASNIAGGPISFSVPIPAGSTFVVVVSDVIATGVPTDTAVGCQYTLSVSGACFTCAPVNLPPVALCQNVTVSAGADCTANASIDNGSFDPEGGPLTITQSPAGPYPLGTTSVLLTVVDNKGATAQCIATVTVVDNTPPTISCPANISVGNNPGLCSAVVSYPAPAVSDNCPGVGTPTCVPPSGSTFPNGTTTVNCSVTDAHGNSSSCQFTVTVDADLSAVSPAKVWLGLKNSDDVGTNFDLLAEVLKNGSTVGTGQLNNVPGGSSGFNNAVLRTINLALSGPTVTICTGDTLSFRLSVRITAVGGHRSGTARLWYNGAFIDSGPTRDAGSRFGATIAGSTANYFLRIGFLLDTTAGSSRQFVDVFADRAVGGNPFKPFGTWSKTF